MVSEEMKKVLDEILKASPGDKVKLAQESLNTFHANLTRNGVEGDVIAKIIMNLTRFFVSADADCTPHEHSFFKAVTGMKVSYEEFYKLTNGGRDTDFVKDTLEFLNGLDEETRDAAITYGIAVLSSDLNHAEAELALIERLLALDGKTEPEMSDEDKAIYEKCMEITEDILLNCIVLGDEEATSQKIGERLEEYAKESKSLVDAKAAYLACKKLESLSFAQIEEIHKTIKVD